MPETKPEWQDAKSSMQFSFRYTEPKMVDGVEFGRLEVMWKDGRTGAYLDVNRRTFDEFLASPSRGRFLNQVLKPSFKYVRGEDEKVEAKKDAAPQTEAREPGIED
jgi:KTSC domain